MDSWSAQTHRNNSHCITKNYNRSNKRYYEYNEQQQSQSMLITKVLQLIVISHENLDTFKQTYNNELVLFLRGVKRGSEIYIIPSLYKL